MKECKNCPHCVKCDGHLVCINKSSDNYDEHIEEIRIVDKALYPVVGDKFFRMA